MENRGLEVLSKPASFLKTRTSITATKLTTRSLLLVALGEERILDAGQLERIFYQIRDCSAGRVRSFGNFVCCLPFFLLPTVETRVNANWLAYYLD
jgi:hypothetical protein